MFLFARDKNSVFKFFFFFFCKKRFHIFLKKYHLYFAPTSKTSFVYIHEISGSFPVDTTGYVNNNKKRKKAPILTRFWIFFYVELHKLNMRQVSRTDIPNTIWLDDVDWLLLNKSFCNTAKSKNSSKLIDSSSLLLLLSSSGGDVNFTEFFCNPSRTMSGTSPTWILASCLGILSVSR